MHPRSSGGGLDRLDVPQLNDDGKQLKDDDGNDKREILLDADDIHKALLDRNKKHFHQAAETPFGHGILGDLVGYSGLSKAAKDIVNGEFLTKYPDVTEAMLPETQQLVTEMAMPEVIKALKKPIPKEIERSDFVHGFKKWKEKTSTSPLGRHLGWALQSNCDGHRGAPKGGEPNG